MIIKRQLLNNSAHWVRPKEPNTSAKELRLFCTHPWSYKHNGFKENFKWGTAMIIPPWSNINIQGVAIFVHDFNGIEQKRSNSMATAMELHLYCINPSKSARSRRCISNTIPIP